TVRMPDNRWWLAQNLNYQGTASKPLHWQESTTTWASISGSNSAERFISYYCPGGADIPASGVLIGSTSSVFHATSAPKIACETYGALYPLRVAATMDGYALSTTAGSRPTNLPGTQNTATSTHRGICPEGWNLPSWGDFGRLYNIVEYKCGSACPPDGSNTLVTGATPDNSPCMHLSIARPVYTCLMQELRGTSLAPAVELRGQKVVTTGVSYGYPDTTRLVSSNTEAVWSYFGYDNAGADRYGFAILPAGYSTVSSYANRGMAYMFATANTSSATTGSGAIADMVYDYATYNAVSAGFSGCRSLNSSASYNASVRCIKK
ncbi:MAG: hypothetical protein ACRCSB_03280, partial [Bacteroidales bacterium]